MPQYLLKIKHYYITNPIIFLFIDPTTSECVQTNTEDDDIIIVTESFIRQLKNEVEIIKTESQSSKLILFI